MLGFKDRDGPSEGFVLNEGESDGMKLGSSDVIITGDKDRLGPYEGDSDGEVVGALVTSLPPCAV